MSRTSEFVRVAYASELIRFPEVYTQSVREAAKRSGTGVFIGNAHRLPYFLDFNASMNPHIFICGVTGSGKTYLMRSLMLKLALTLDSLILLIDFTGEYKEFVELAGEEEASMEQLPTLLRSKPGGIVYLNLKECGDENTRVARAESALQAALANMKSGAQIENHTFIFLDEAWKLLAGSKALQTILREGRKYKHGLIFSTQLLEDMELSMLSNAATLFIFRLQNKQGLDKLAKNYKLDQKHIELIQKLGVGSCVVLQSNSLGGRSFCLIGKVHGIAIEEFVRIFVGGRMRYEIEKSRFEKAVGRVCNADLMSQALAISTKKGHLELSELIALMLGAGVRNRKILAVLRDLGLDETTIADSFAVAVSNYEANYEDRQKD